MPTEARPATMASYRAARDGTSATMSKYEVLTKSLRSSRLCAVRLWSNTTVRTCFTFMSIRPKRTSWNAGITSAKRSVPRSRSIWTASFRKTGQNPLIARLPPRPASRRAARSGSA